MGKQVRVGLVESPIHNWPDLGNLINRVTGIMIRSILVILHPYFGDNRVIIEYIYKTYLKKKKKKERREWVWLPVESYS